MKIGFVNLHVDGDVKTKWDVLLGVVGELFIAVDAILIYREVDFPLLELAVQVTRWRKKGTVGDFIYTSLESEIEGLLRFETREPDSWTVSAFHQIRRVPRAVSTEELFVALDRFIEDLRSAVPAYIHLPEELLKSSPIPE